MFTLCTGLMNPSIYLSFWYWIITITLENANLRKIRWKRPLILSRYEYLKSAHFWFVDPLIHRLFKTRNNKNKIILKWTENVFIEKNQFFCGKRRKDKKENKVREGFKKKMFYIESNSLMSRDMTLTTQGYKYLVWKGESNVMARGAIDEG